MKEFKDLFPKIFIDSHSSHEQRHHSRNGSRKDKEFLGYGSLMSFAVCDFKNIIGKVLLRAHNVLITNITQRIKKHFTVQRNPSFSK